MSMLPSTEIQREGPRCPMTFRQLVWWVPWALFWVLKEGVLGLYLMDSALWSEMNWVVNWDHGVHFCGHGQLSLWYGYCPEADSIVRNQGDQSDWLNTCLEIFADFLKNGTDLGDKTGDRSRFLQGPVLPFPCVPTFPLWMSWRF